MSLQLFRPTAQRMEWAELPFPETVAKEQKQSHTCSLQPLPDFQVFSVCLVHVSKQKGGISSAQISS